MGPQRPSNTLSRPLAAGWIAATSWLVGAGAAATPSPAFACGGEVPISCNTDRDDARMLLKRAVSAVQANPAEALTWFSDQSHGFRTADLYVFCIGPDGLMAAHPDAKLRGTDARVLMDDRGFRFGDEMIRTARPGRVSDIAYRWPRLEEARPTLKHTMYTKVADEICAVGYYD